MCLLDLLGDAHIMPVDTPRAGLLCPRSGNHQKVDQQWSKLQKRKYDWKPSSHVKESSAKCPLRYRLTRKRSF